MSDGGKNKSGSTHLRGENIAGQLRAIFAKGHLRRGPGGKLKYKKKVDATDARGLGARLSKAGFGRGNHNTNAAKSNAYGNGRFVIGAKAAHLRGGGGGGAPKADHSATRAARIATGRNIAHQRAISTMRSEPTRENMAYRLRVLENKDTRGLSPNELKRHRGDIGALKGVLKRDWVGRIPLPGAVKHQGTMKTRVALGKGKADLALSRGVKYGNAVIAHNAGGFGVRGAYNKDAIRDAKRDGGQWKDGM